MKDEAEPDGRPKALQLLVTDCESRELNRKDPIREGTGGIEGIRVTPALDRGASGLRRRPIGRNAQRRFCISIVVL